MKLLEYEKRKALEHLRWLKENLHGVVLTHQHQLARDVDVETLLGDGTEEALRIAIEVLEGTL